MKKNMMMRLASVLLVATLLSTCAISGTFAKYTSSATATDTAHVAKWDVKIGDLALGVASQEFTFNLFDTIVDTKNGTPKTDGTAVAADHIAPGTSGSFDIVLTNSSEVAAQFDIEFSISGENVPFVWTVTCGSQTNDTLTGFTAVALPLSDAPSTVTVRVAWEWPFEAVAPNTNAADTALGLIGGDVTVSANITVTQVD